MNSELNAEGGGGVSSTDLLACVEKLNEIVEGVRNMQWQSWRDGKCIRLTDEPEWCALYVAMNKARAARGCGKPHPCGCGTADRPHNIGEYGCARYMVEAPKPAGKHSMMGCQMWDVGDRDGLAITDLTLREQRGYWQHPCGCWSRWPGSSNSI